VKGRNRNSSVLEPKIISLVLVDFIKKFFFNFTKSSPGKTLGLISKPRKNPGLDLEAQEKSWV
jgi:hypothetical protein